MADFRNQIMLKTGHVIPVNKLKPNFAVHGRKEMLRYKANDINVRS